MEKFTLKAMIISSIYKTTTKLLREECFEWIIYHTNVKPSCVSSDVDNVLNPESNQKEVFPKLLM